MHLRREAHVHERHRRHPRRVAIGDRELPPPSSGAVRQLRVQHHLRVEGCDHRRQLRLRVDQTVDPGDPPDDQPGDHVRVDVEEALRFGRDEQQVERAERHQGGDQPHTVVFGNRHGVGEEGRHGAGHGPPLLLDDGRLGHRRRREHVPVRVVLRRARRPARRRRDHRPAVRSARHQQLLHGEHRGPVGGEPVVQMRQRRVVLGRDRQVGPSRRPVDRRVDVVDAVPTLAVADRLLRQQPGVVVGVPAEGTGRRIERQQLPLRSRLRSVFAQRRPHPEPTRERARRDPRRRGTRPPEVRFGHDHRAGAARALPRTHAVRIASAVRRPETNAPWIEPVSRWSPHTHRCSPTRTSRARVGRSATSCRGCA